MNIDRNKMAHLLTIKTGINYKPDDPIFSIMEINQILIDECVAHEKKVIIDQITEGINLTLNKYKDKIFNLFMIAIFFACALGMAIGKFIL
ncbi:MAG: hypothetical protein RLZZ210_1234 [Pseudomonadota bacterium]|jgi:hypothetical protein